MAKEKKKTLEELVQEALENVRDDRQRILDAYNNMKTSLDASNPEQSVLLGHIAAKVLEQLTKSNEQIVRLAQIKEREETKKDLSKKTPLDIDDLINAVEKDNEDSDKTN